MPDKLIIVESPTKIKSIKKIVGSKYTIAASVGHIRDLPTNELGVDVDHDFKPKYVALAGKKKVVSDLRKLVKGHKEIYLACDPDREGEAIAWHIKELLDIPEKRYFRITTNEITAEGVAHALANPRKINMDMVNAQQARRILDRLVGYLISPLLWRKIRRGLSAGRVQSVAVKLIVEREKEIKAFVSQEYWTIDALCTKTPADAAADGFLAHLSRKNGEKIEIKDREASDAVCADLKQHDFIVSDVKKKQTRSQPSAPFKTSTLQRRAANNLKYSASKTMQIAQQLYEGIELGERGSTGLITYMRTDSIRVADSALVQVREYIQSAYGDKYLPDTARVYKGAKRSQEAHEAIRPTNVDLTPDTVKDYLTRDQNRLYAMIWGQFVASQMKDALFNSTSLLINAGPYQFNVQGREMIFDGYTRVSGSVKTEMDRQQIPVLNTGDKVHVHQIKPEQHFTKPPARYTQASLIKTLEEEGIGRPSTYASILSTILARKYVLLTQGSFHATLLGTTVTERLDIYFADIMDIKFTAHLEDDLDAIAESHADWIKILAQFYKSFDADLQKAKANMKSTKGEEAERTTHKCEKCGRTMVIRWGPRGAFLGCEGYLDPEAKCVFTLELDEDGKISQNMSGPIEGAAFEGSPIQLKRGRFGYYLATESGINAALPKNMKPEDLNAENAVSIVAATREAERALGTLEDGSEVFIKRGRYGPYLQVLNGEKKRNVPLALNVDAAGFTFEDAKQIVSLPRVIGIHPEDGEDVTLNYGRYGGFVKCGAKTHSTGSQPFEEITLEIALEILAKPKKRGRRKKAAAEGESE